MVQKTLNVDDEFAALGDGIKTVILDIKAKKSAGEDIGDAATQLLPALEKFASFGGDVKKVDNQVYLIKSLADALEPQPAV